jgi:hypothetical protein
MMRRLAVLLALLLLSDAVFAVPLGYRYIGSRVVAEGRHVYWYWNPDFFQLDGSGGGFVAQLHARNLELNQERAFVAIIRCDSRTYRRADSKDPFDRIEEGDPVYEVWRAGCDGTRAATLPERLARMDGTSGTRAAASPPPAVTVRAAVPLPPAAAPATPAPAAPAAAPPASRGDDLRVDSCIRFAERSVSQFVDGTITNTCNFPVEIAYCYKGGRGGAFDCPSPPRMKRVDSLEAGATRNLLEYKRGSNSGVALVACKGTMGTVTPVLNGDGGKTGCN